MQGERGLDQFTAARRVNSHAQPGGLVSRAARRFAALLLESGRKAVESAAASG